MVDLLVEGILKDLMTVCQDGQTGYSEAAKKAHNPEYKSVFEALAEQRAQFIAELQGMLSASRSTPGDTNVHGSASGDIYRNWIKLKLNFVSDEDRMILEAINSKIVDAIQEYEEALRNPDLPSPVHDLINRQHGIFEEDRSLLSSLLAQH